MGRLLYDTQPVFRAALDRAARALKGILARPLLDVLYGPAGGDDLDLTAFTQPACPFKVCSSLPFEASHSFTV